MRLSPVAALVAAVVVVGAFAGQASAGTCAATGHVLVNQHGVVVWTAHAPDPSGNEGSVFMCASPSGQTVRLRSSSRYLLSQVTNASVTQLRFAGNFVGFFLRTNVEVYSKFLVVFDRLHGRTELIDLAECDNNDECTGPSMTSYRMAPNGWVAELWPDVVSHAAGLLATNGTRHYQLDLTEISQLRLSGRMLHWTSYQFGASSIKLGSAVITPTAPRSLSACRLLTASDLAPVLGPNPSSSPSGTQCAYASTTNPGRTLTLKLKTGLTPAQTKARERTLTNSPNYCQLGQWWPTDDDFYDLEGLGGGNACYSGPGTDRFVAFAGGAKVALALTSPGTGGGGEVAHLANVALDRLFGVPVKRG